MVLGLDFQEAVKVLRPLHQDLRGAFSGKQSVPSQRFCLQVRQDLAHSLTMASTIQYHKFLLDNKLYAIPSEFLEGWLNNVDQAISLDPQNSIHYLSKAIYLFLQGNVDGAIRAEKQAEWHSPRAASIANFGLAFLYNFKGDFRQSGRQYRTALAKKTSYEEGMIHQCLAFTRQSIARFPEKKQLRLALAVLELERGSSERGMQALQEFLADLPHPGELLEFVAEAKRLLEAARSSEGSSGTADGLEKTPP